MLIPATALLAIDGTSIIEAIGPVRPLLELAAVILASALIGFLTGRFIYRGQVRDRTRELRAEYVISRRRLSAARSGLSQARDEKARITRRMKREQYSGRSSPQA